MHQFQGTAADFVKIAMVEVGQYLEKENLEKDVKMLAQVHDELVFEMKEPLVESICPQIEKIMEGVLENFKEIDKKYKKIPLLVDVIVGDNWGELK